MPAPTCPYCSAELTTREAREAWCNNCGSKLPSSIAPSAVPQITPSEPSKEPDHLVYHDDDFANRFRNDGPSEEKQQAAKEAAMSLFAVALVQVICGGIALVAMGGLGGQNAIPRDAMPFLFAIMIGVVVVYCVLGAWAYTQPMPPLVIGLIIYLGLLALDFAGDPGVAARGIILKIVLIIGMVRALTKVSNAK